MDNVTRLPPRNDPTTVYRMFNSDGAVIYVGITNNLRARLRQHAGDKSWYGEVSRIESRAFDTRTEALEVEATLIRELTPRYNVAGNSLHAIEEHVKYLLSQAPPLTDVQLERVAELLRAGRRDHG